jgi:hypothetical protein
MVRVMIDANESLSKVTDRTAENEKNFVHTCTQVYYPNTRGGSGPKHAFSKQLFVWELVGK